MKNIDVELVRKGTTDGVVVAEGISAHGEDESWSLTFQVPDLEPGKYLINAQEHGRQGAAARTCSYSALMRLRGLVPRDRSRHADRWGHQQGRSAVAGDQR
jgi:hypothetical protein